MTFADQSEADLLIGGGCIFETARHHSLFASLDDLNELRLC